MLLSLGKFETMKKFIFPLFIMTLTLGSCNMANDDDYKNLAKDMCDCVNKHATGLSDGMRNVLIESGKDGADGAKLMEEYYKKDLEQGLKDQQALEKIGVESDECITNLQKKYADINTNDSEAEVQNKLIAELKKQKGCELTHALIKISQKAGM